MFKIANAVKVLPMEESFLPSPSVLQIDLQNGNRKEFERLAELGHNHEFNDCSAFVECLIRLFRNRVACGCRNGGGLEDGWMDGWMDARETVRQALCMDHWKAVVEGMKSDEWLGEE